MAKVPIQDERMRFWTAGVEFAVTIGLLTWGGYWLDTRRDTLPLWMLVGLSVGFAAALYRLIRQARPRNKPEPSDDSEETRKE